MKLRFELCPGNATFPGPKLIVPCRGPAEEGNMKGWSDGTANILNFAPDYSISHAVSAALKVGGDAGDAGREIIRKRQTNVESEITQMVRVQPDASPSPRESESVYQYRYSQMELYVVVEGGEQFGSLIGQFFVPNASPILDSTRPCSATPKANDCTYGGFGYRSGDMNAMIPLPAADRHPTGFVGAVYEPAHAEMILKSGFEIRGIDFNAVSVTEPAKVEINWILLPCGTVLVPSNNGFQAMITVDPLLLSQEEFASLTPENLAAKNIAVHCLEIEKAPPDPSLKFTPSRASDPTYRNLAQLTQSSAIKGPWDQARIWIYADKTSLEKVNKRLAIGCPPGMYVRSLWEVYVMGGLTDKDLTNPDLFKPEYLGAVSNRKNVAPWIAGVLARHHQAALIKYLGGEAKEFAGLITSTNPLASDSFLRSAYWLLTFNDPAIRIATLKFLDSQDAAALKKAIGKPAPNWERHIQASGEESELGKKLKAKLM